MSERLPWFRCFPSALLGALAGMQPDEGFVYAVALLRIYETGGPVAETARTLARRTGMTERRAAIALDGLIASGKLSRLDDGRIDAESTHDEIAWQTEMRQANSVAGKMSAEKRAGKSQQNQRNGATRVQRASNDKEKESSSLRSEEESSEATPLHSPRDRAHVWPADWRDQVWRAYGKRTSQKKANDRLTALHRSDRLAFDVLLRALEAATASVSDPHFLPELERWLREERWTDEHPPPAAQRPPPAQAPTRRKPPSNLETFGGIFFETFKEPTHDSTDRSDDDQGPFAEAGWIPAGPGEPGTGHPGAQVFEFTGAGRGRLSEEGHSRFRRAFEDGADGAGGPPRRAAFGDGKG